MGKKNRAIASDTDLSAHDSSAREHDLSDIDVSAADSHDLAACGAACGAGGCCVSLRYRHGARCAGDSRVRGAQTQKTSVTLITSLDLAATHPGACRMSWRAYGIANGLSS